MKILTFFLMPSSSFSSMASLLFLLFVTSLTFTQSLSESSPATPPLFLYALQSQCSIAVSPNPPLQVDWNFIESILSNRKSAGYISILFYASWCPFSQKMLPEYEIISSMFPQVEHLAVEQSSALPSLYSKYGIHSLPAILLVNQTSSVRYRGPHNLDSLVGFYERNTAGFKANDYIAAGRPSSLINDEYSTKNSLLGLSLKEISSREPYLMFSILFLFLRMLLFVFPWIMSRLRAFWISYIPHFNLQIFGETSQVMGHVLNAIDVRRIWNKLRLCKTRNFHESARSAKALASSLASVSLGKSS